MTLLEKAACINPIGRPAAEIEFYLGMGHRRLGDETAAKGRFKKALEQDPSFMPALLAGQT
jgi:Tfp pilus assembly protein PilF